MTTLPHTARSRSFLSFLDPLAAARSLWSHRELTWQFADRRIRAKYKGQALGLFWSLLDPLMTLAIYTFVFGFIFQRASAGGGGEDGASGGMARYALEVFAGILVFTLFRETVGPAPTLVASQPNFVKKVVYPLETFPVSQVLVSLFNFAVGMIIWIIGYCIFSASHIPSPGLLLLPIVILPVVVLGLGISWFLASLGVFLRDLQTPTANILQMLFFMSAIFYRIEDVPEPFRILIELNPFAQSVTMARTVMFGDSGEWWPSAGAWSVWGATLAVGLVLCLLGYAFFMKSRKAFADVI
ncbi:O-antigen export system permease protein RfbD [hydrothermal vent metagenome]|uniref:O-antigen export system permease protein RfbD n=1 Tax=hydrothermal vent metagenome TaxID=652676 RepID=A0A3B1DFD3_9ZZZZ